MISKTKKMLAKKIQLHAIALEKWFAEKTKEAPPSFYCSVDLRDSGDKIAPVDCNLYPAGFNNICSQDIRAATHIFHNTIVSFSQSQGREIPRKILILPEFHTKNKFYIENIYYLMGIVRDAGFEVCLGWRSEETIQDPVALISETEKPLTAYPMKVIDGKLMVRDFVPDLVLLNNDFSGGYPHFLDHVRQPVLPSHTLGWHTRKKSEHFVVYNQLAKEFSDLVGIDPWTIQIETQEVSPVDFANEGSTEQVCKAAQTILDSMTENYRTHQVSDKPFVYIKNNTGTYGMGIMMVHSVEEIKTMNRRTKNKMSVGKNHSQIESVIVQEGIPTSTIVNRLAAEPVIYLFGCELIGGFLRANKKRGREDNLNSVGMVFKTLCMSDLKKPEIGTNEEGSTEGPILELVYGTIARISALASGREFKEHSKKNNPTGASKTSGLPSNAFLQRVETYTTVNENQCVS